jgi:alpha-tubulin suppressor-like RCC1 family protein
VNPLGMMLAYPCQPGANHLLWVQTTSQHSAGWQNFPGFDPLARGGYIVNSQKRLCTTRQRHSLLRRTDGSVWGWGVNTGFVLGDGTQTTRLIPVRSIVLTP